MSSMYDYLPLLILFFIGLLVCFVGGIMLLVAAFTESVWWGLGCLFLGPVSLIYTIVHWAEAKRAFLVSCVGMLMMAPFFFKFFSDPKMLEQMAQLQNGPNGPNKSRVAQTELKSEGAKRVASPELTVVPPISTPAPDSAAAQIARKQAAFDEHAAKLKAKYDELQARRTQLKTGDAAVAQFNQEAAEYQALRQQVDAELTELNALRAAPAK